MDIYKQHKLKQSMVYKLDPTLFPIQQESLPAVRALGTNIGSNKHALLAKTNLSFNPSSTLGRLQIGDGTHSFGKDQGSTNPYQSEPWDSNNNNARNKSSNDKINSLDTYVSQNKN